MPRHTNLLLIPLLTGVALAQQEPAPPAGTERRLDAQEQELRALREELEALKRERSEAPAPDAGPLEELQPDPAEGFAPPLVTSGHAEGIELGLFYIRSADHEHELSLHARIMLDGMFDLARDYFDHRFQVRRARFTVAGHVFQKVGFKLGLEHGRTAAANLRDAYIRLALLEELEIWGGQMLLPFSTERLTSSNYMKHPERPIIVELLGGRRDVGAQLHGRLLDKRISYWFGIYNGTGQNVAQDSDDDFDLATRVEVRPFEGFQLSANYIFTPTNRSAIGPLDVRTVGDQASRFLDYDTLAIRRLGKRHRLGGGFKFDWGPLQLKGEVLADYVRRALPPGGGETENLLTWGWFLDASCVLTGEENRDIVVPNSPLFGPEGWGSGAFEVALRYEDFRADPEATRRGFAVGTDKARAGTVTLTWIPVERLRLMVSYTGTAFADPVADPHGSSHHSDHVLLTRLHVFF